MAISVNDDPTVLRFDRYMERCLYDPGAGFYATGTGSAGRRHGDFITSPEVGPLFGRVLARMVETEAEQISVGRADDGPPPASGGPITVLDVGSGPGTLVTAMRQAVGPGVDVLGVDVAAASGTDSDRLVVPHAAVPAEAWQGAIVIANELLDNLPFRIVEVGESGDLAEVFVDWSERHQPTECLRPWSDVAALEPAGNKAPQNASAEFADLAGDLAPGTRFPLVTEAAAWVNQTLQRGVAAIVAFDYGAPTTAEVAARRSWLRTYRHHQRGHDPYFQPGQWDITTDVPFDQLPPPRELTTQAEWLRRWGIDELVEEGRRYWRDHAAAPDLTALRMRSRVPEAEALTDPEGLGGWQVAIWRSTQ